MTMIVTDEYHCCLCGDRKKICPKCKERRKQTIKMASWKTCCVKWYDMGLSVTVCRQCGMKLR